MTTLSVIPLYLLQQFQSTLNSAARLVFSPLKDDSFSPLLYQLYSLKAPERTQCKLPILPFKVLHGTAPLSRADEFLWSSDLEAQGRLCSTLSSHWSSVVHDCRLSATEHFHSSLSFVQQTTMPSHVCIVPLSLFQSSEDSSFQLFLSWLALVSAVNCVVIGHFNNFYLVLLTYWFSSAIFPMSCEKTCFIFSLVSAIELAHKQFKPSNDSIISRK